MLAFRREWGKGGGCAPCTPLGGGRELALAGRAPFLTFPRVRGQGQRYPGRGAPPVPCWGNGGFVVACALLQRGDWLSLRRCPTAHPPTFLETRGLAVPPAGAAPLHPAWGTGASLPCLPPSVEGGARCACWTGGLVVACALLQRGGWLGLRRCPTWPTLQRSWKQGDTLYLRRGCAPCTLRGVCFGLRPPSAGGLAWPAPLSQVAHPPTLLETGGHAVPPAGAAPPAPCLGNGGFVLACALLQRGDWLGLHRCPTGPPSNVFGNRGTPPVPPAGAAPPAPCLGNGGFVLACALLQRWGWLGVRRCPTGPPSNVFRNRGTRCTPAGAAPLHPAWGTGGLFWLAPSFSGGAGLACVVVPPAHPPTFLETGGLPLYARRGLRPLHAAWGTGGASLSHLPPSAGGGTRCACWMGGFVVACAVLQRGDWLGVRRCPTGPPSNVFGNRGTPPVPPAGTKGSLHLPLGDR